jgi:serine/threonine-protein kinase RsbW
MSNNKTKKFFLQINSDTKLLRKVEKLSAQVARYAMLNESESDDLAIVTTELVNNAIHHGNHNNPEKKVSIVFLVNSKYIEIRIKDEGRGFNPTSLKNPLAPENLLSESGRGIFLIKYLMDRIDFNFTKTGTETIVIKNLH